MRLPVICQAGLDWGWRSECYMIVWHCVCSHTQARLCVSVHVHVCASVHACGVYMFASVDQSECDGYAFVCMYVDLCFFSVCSPLFALWISIFCRYCRSALVIRKTCVDSISPCFFRFLSGVLPTYEMSWIAVDRSHPLLIFDTRTCSKFLTKLQDKAVPLTAAS